MKIEVEEKRLNKMIEAFIELCNIANDQAYFCNIIKCVFLKQDKFGNNTCIVEDGGKNEIKKWLKGGE